MKQWVQDGIIMCSYRNIRIGSEEAAETNTIVSKAWAYNMMCIVLKVVVLSACIITLFRKKRICALFLVMGSPS